MLTKEEWRALLNMVNYRIDDLQELRNTIARGQIEYLQRIKTKIEKEIA